MATFKTTYKFRAFAGEEKKAKVADMLPKDSNFNEFFIEDGKNSKDQTKYRRPDIEVELSEPEFFEQIEDAQARECLQDVVRDYVQATYIDNYLTVAEHGWEAITKWLKKAKATGGRATAKISEAVLKEAAESLQNFITATTGSETIAKGMADVVERKCSQRAFTLTFKACTEKLVTQFGKQLDNWAENLAETDEVTDDLVEAYDFLTAKIADLKESFSTDLQAEMFEVFGEID